MLSSWWSTLKTIVDPVVNIVSIVLGLIGFVKLLPIFAKFLKGEPTSADAFLNHGGGFVIAFVIKEGVCRCRLALEELGEDRKELHEADESQDDGNDVHHRVYDGLESRPP